MITQVVMIRVGILDEELAWYEIGSFAANGVRYSLHRAKSILNPENYNYLFQIEVEGIVVRRARVGLISSATRGLNYEMLPTNPDGMLTWFLDVKGQYLNNGDDWFTMAMTIGELYYTNEMTSLTALSFEMEQRRAILEIQPNFAITFNKLDNIIQDDHSDVEGISDSIELDDIWKEWGDDDISD